MFNYEPLNVLPQDIQTDWMAQLHKATPTEKGFFDWSIFVALLRKHLRSRKLLCWWWMKMASHAQCAGGFFL